MFFTGSPFSSRKRAQKSLMPGPFITATRSMFLPFLRVRRLDAQSSWTIRLSPDISSTSSPLSHHMEAELDPAESLTFSMSRSQFITHTPQKSTP